MIKNQTNAKLDQNLYDFLIGRWKSLPGTRMKLDPLPNNSKSLSSNPYLGGDSNDLFVIFHRDGKFEISCNSNDYCRTEEEFDRMHESFIGTWKIIKDGSKESIEIQASSSYALLNQKLIVRSFTPQAFKNNKWIRADSINEVKEKLMIKCVASLFILNQYAKINHYPPEINYLIINKLYNVEFNIESKKVVSLPQHLTFSDHRKLQERFAAD